LSVAYISAHVKEGDLILACSSKFHLILTLKNELNNVMANIKAAPKIIKLLHIVLLMCTYLFLELREIFFKIIDLK
jgi:hypothetical protein